MKNISSKKQFDPNTLAHSIVEHVVKRPTKNKPTKEKNPAAVALGRLGGLKGGKARAKALSSERRKEIAKKAAESRWKIN